MFDQLCFRHLRDSWKDTAVKHAVCGAFLFFLNELSKIAPARDFTTMETHLKHQFAWGYMDADLTHVLETQVPPGSLAGVSAFRPGFMVSSSLPSTLEVVA